MTTSRVVADDTIKQSRFFGLVSKIMGILTQIKLNEYPYNPEDLDKHLQDAHDGNFTGAWAHPLHFVLTMDGKDLYEEFRRLRQDLPKWLSSMLYDAEPPTYRHQHFSVVTDFWALMEDTITPDTIAHVDTVLSKWGLVHARIWDLWAISTLRLKQRDTTILAAGERKKEIRTLDKLYYVPGFSLDRRDFIEVAVHPEHRLSTKPGRFGLLVVHKNDPWRVM